MFYKESPLNDLTTNILNVNNASINARKLKKISQNIPRRYDFPSLASDFLEGFFDGRFVDSSTRVFDDVDVESVI